jgi:hypothetical protein
MFSSLLLESTPDDERATTTGPAPGKATLTSRLTPRPRAADRWSEAPAPGGDGLAPSAGAPLPSSLRARFEHSLGADLSMVRIHDGAESARSASALDARAFTVGSDIHFAAGQYQPEDPFGMHLLAHEVAHTAQQAGHPPVAQAKLNVSTPGDASEDEADRAADAMVAGRPTSVASRPAAVYRSPNGSTSASTGSAGAPAAGPGGTFRKAGSFAQLIKLVEEAEARLAAAGLASTPQEVVHILRGIYYGTSWSMDFEGSGNEGSEMRNIGFDYYTKTTRPDDPRPALGESLFLALRNSAEVTDPAGKGTDFGHIMAGLDAQNWAARTLPTGSGGTGLDVVTWLGDIGGGGGMLAMNRGGAMAPRDPDATAYGKFSLPHDYGASVNIEGDIAGTVGVEVSPDRPFSASLAAYLNATEEGGERYNQRAQLFLEFLGGTVVDGKLADESALIDKLADQCETFGTIYAITRMQSKGAGTPATVRETGRHIAGASREMATIYVKTLAAALSDPKKPIQAKADMDPGVTAAAPAPTTQFELAALAMEAAEGAKDGAEWADREFDKERRRQGW